MVVARKILLVLDVNGLLIDTYFQAEQRPDRPHDAKVNRFYVYKRTGCEDFVKFCLENFVVGVWSSAREHNVMSLVEYMFKEAKDKLAFIWHQMHCTDTKLKHPENKNKPVFLKELSKLWDKTEPDLPWEKGDFGPSNTVLIDDSPYKALRNPPYTGIFPATYKATGPEDNYLVGKLRKYLEGLLEAADVQVYLEKNPFGMPSLDHKDEHYLFFSSVKNSTEIPTSPGQPPASPKQEERKEGGKVVATEGKENEKVVAVANSAAETVVALRDADVFATSRRRRGRTKFGSTVEESLEYCAGEHAHSPRDFAERLSRVVDAAQNALCERDPLSFEGTNDPAGDGILGRPPSHGDAYCYNPRNSSHDRDRARSRLCNHQDGQFHVQSQRRDHAEARHAPFSGRRASVNAVDGQWNKGGLDSHHKYNLRSGSGTQWVSAGPDPQQQNRGHFGAMDSNVLNRWGGNRNGEWQGREREWDNPSVAIKHRSASANHSCRLSSERLWHSPTPFVDYNSRTRMQGGGTNHLEDHSRRGWSGDSRSSYRGVSPYNGRPRDREVLQKDKIVHRGRPRDREHTFRDMSRDPEFSLRAGLRSFDHTNNLGSREYEIAHRVGAREHEDFDRSYARAPLSQHDGYTRGRTRQREEWGSIHGKISHAYDSERLRARSRHHEDLDRGYKRPSHMYDSGVEGGPNNDYDEIYMHNKKVRRTYDDRSEDGYAKSRSRNWRDVDKGHNGTSESHGRRDDDIPGRSVRSSSRNYDHAHSRGRHSKSWRNDHKDQDH